MHKGKQGTMLQLAPLAVFLSLALGSHAGLMYTLCDNTQDSRKFHKFTAKMYGGGDRNMSDYYGNVTVVVNLATFCGFTYQYLQMNEILKNHPHLPITFLGFPCNQFAHQEPADNATELFNGLKHVRPGSGYVPSFEILAKGDVNGENEMLLYTYLKTVCPNPLGAKFSKTNSFWDPIMKDDVNWNFSKFVVDKVGRLRYRLLPDVTPNDIKDILIQLAMENLDQDITQDSNIFHLQRIDNKYAVSK